MISKDTNDANGATTSFNGDNNGWSDDLAPSAADDYTVGEFVLRTPDNGGSYTFAGNSLTITGNAYPNGLLYEGTGTTGILTVNNLILNGGLIAHANGLGDQMRLAGNLSVTANSEIRAKQGLINVGSAISGASNITIGATDGIDDRRAVTFSGASTLSGNIVTAATSSTFILADTGSLTFSIGANGVTNNVSGTGTAKLNGTFNLNLSSADLTAGNSWNLVTGTKVFGTTFAVAGFTALNDVWTNGAGTLQFSELTGTLTALAPIPEPSSLAALVSLAVLDFGTSRRRRA